MILSILLLFLRILDFAIRLAIENHLGPGIVFFEYADDVHMMEVRSARRVHKSAVLHAVFLEFLLIALRYIESFQDLVILKLKTGLCCAVLDHAKNLKIENWAHDEASISANILVADFSFAHIALELDLDKINLNNESANLDDMPDNVVRGHGLKELNSVVGCEVVHFLLNLSYDFEV